MTDNRGNEVKLSTTITVQSLPVNVSGPAISGSAVAGHLLTESNGSWSGASPPFTYQWQRCDASGANCSAISTLPASLLMDRFADASTLFCAGESMRNICIVRKHVTAFGARDAVWRIG